MSVEPLINMKKEFNLSDKITFDLFKKGYEDEEPVEGLDVRDVKEFIKRLKENIPNNEAWYGIGGKKMILDEIDKLAGSSLVEND